MEIETSVYLCTVMKRQGRTLLIFFTVLISNYATNLNPDYKTPISTIYLMPNVYPAVISEGDTIACMWLSDFIKYSPITFRNTKEQVAYSKLVRDVKKTLPYAKEIANIITETYEYMETLPNNKVRQQHLNKMEKLTRSQGQLLMKLVDRETNSSSYHIIDAFMGSFKAWSANLFAKLFGNDLKIRYNPYGEDRVTERVCVLVEQGVV